MKSYPYFSKVELECHCRRCNGEMSDAFMDKLVRLREKCGFAFNLGSAYRCPEHNAKVGGGEFSGHLFGRAADVVVSGKDAYLLISLAAKYGMTGIGVKQHGPYEDRFIHIDDLDGSSRQPRSHIWSYS